MAINVTIDGVMYEGVEVITVGGKTLSLAYSANSGSGENTGGGGSAEAVLPEDGLIAFFDLRNAENVKIGGGYGFNSTQGSGSLYAWYSSTVSEDGYGFTGAVHTLSAAGTTTNIDIGTEYTILAIGKDNTSEGISVISINANADGNLDRWVKPEYVDSSGNKKSVPNQVTFAPATSSYNVYTVRVNGAIYDYFVESTLIRSFDGSDIEGFAYWPKIAAFQAKPYNEKAWITAVAIYNRALSDVDIVEAVAFLHTLEVA